MDTIILEYLKNHLIFFNNIIIDNLIDICENNINLGLNKPIQNKSLITLNDIKCNNTNKGKIFEHFCFLYLKYFYKIDQVWLYKDIPTNIKNELHLTNNDMGIDLIAKNNNGDYYAIQAKFRKRNKTRTTISWKELSTFYANVATTGPYKKHIIITTADSVRHIGKKTDKDITINYNTLKKITNEQWRNIFLKNTVYILKNTISNEVIIPELTYEEICKKILKYYQKK